MNEGKALVLGTVLKHERPFKAAIIGETTGLSRQLVRYHLMQLVNVGALVKEGPLYFVADKGIVVDALIDSTSRAEHSKAYSTKFYTETNAQNLNTVLEWVVALRTLENEKAHEFQTTTLTELDATIAVFRNVKKWLTNTVMSPNVARKMVQQRSEELKPIYKLLNGTEQGFTEWQIELIEKGNE